MSGRRVGIEGERIYAQGRDKFGERFLLSSGIDGSDDTEYIVVEWHFDPHNLPTVINLPLNDFDRAYQEFTHRRAQPAPTRTDRREPMDQNTPDTRHDQPGPFDYVAPVGSSTMLMQVIRHRCKDLATAITVATPPSRERSLALTKLEEASMWANKAIVFHQATDDGA